MTTDIFNQYCALMSELLIMREAEGGDLPVETESSYVERLDDLWWQLSQQEQAAYEEELAGASPPVSQERLELVDCEVNQGDHAAPRKQAA